MASFTRQEALYYQAALSQADYSADILGVNGMSTDEFAAIICQQSV